MSILSLLGKDCARMSIFFNSRGSRFPDLHSGTSCAVLIPIVSANKTVLIVEDNENLRDLLTVIVQSSGYQAATASTGQDGVDKALAERPDLILMDIGLPKLDGIEATRQIKAAPSTQNIPVVILTALPMARGVEGIKAGAAKVLQKPASVTAIKDILTEYISERPSALV